MAVAAGVPVPEIYVLDCERGINAFAAGNARDDVAIGVTFGALKLLNRDELQGIIAHEFSHVVNGDTRLNMKLMALAHGLFWPTIVGRMLVRGSTRAPEIGESIFDEGTKSGFSADRADWRFIFDYWGHQRALRTIDQKPDLPRARMAGRRGGGSVHAQSGGHRRRASKKSAGFTRPAGSTRPYAETASHLYFANSAYDPWFNFLSTHPPLAKRILAIDPAFDGQFPHINSLPRQTDETRRRNSI